MSRDATLARDSACRRAPGHRSRLTVPNASLCIRRAWIIEYGKCILSRPIWSAMVTGGSRKDGACETVRQPHGYCALVAALGRSPLRGRRQHPSDCFSDDSTAPHRCLLRSPRHTRPRRQRQKPRPFHAGARLFPQGPVRSGAARLRQAITLDPSSAMALNNRAWITLQAQQAGRALADVEQSMALAPGSPHAHDTRARTSGTMGEPASGAL